MKNITVIAETSESSCDDDVVSCSLIEQNGTKLNPGSKFFLEFGILTSGGMTSQMSVPINRNLAHYIAMTLSENLEYIFEKDDERNGYDDSYLFIRSRKKDVITNIEQEATKFKILAKDFGEYVKNSEIIK